MDKDTMFDGVSFERLSDERPPELYVKEKDGTFRLASESEVVNNAHNDIMVQAILKAASWRLDVQSLAPEGEAKTYILRHLNFVLAGVPVTLMPFVDGPDGEA